MIMWTGEEPNLNECDIVYPYPSETDQRPDLIHPFED